MMLKREAPHKPSNATRWLRSVGAGVLATAASLALAAGCLQRPVQPHDPNTSNWLDCPVTTYDEQGFGPNGTRGEPLAPLPPELFFDRDTNLTVRAWSATVAYLLADFTFLFD